MDVSAFDQLAVRIPQYGALLLRVPEEVKEQAFDIHLKSGQPLAVCGREGAFFLRENGEVTRALTAGVLRVSPESLREVFVQACGQSVFSHEQEIRMGYVSMGASCRAGVCGTAVLENGKIKSVRDISSLVFRIPREAPGCADRLFLEGTDLRRGVLVAGEPSSGKTTLLRDIARSLSLGKFQPNRRVAVLDERGEIGGGFDLGPCADVLTGYPKERAFDVAIRMLSPEFLVCDELSPGDIETVRNSVFAGASLIASIHAGRRELRKRPLCRELLATGAFGTVVYLAGRAKPGEIEWIETEKGEGSLADTGSGPDHFQRAGSGMEQGGTAERPGGPAG